MDIIYEKNALTAAQYQAIRTSTGRKPLPLLQIENALAADLYNVIATHGGQPIGMGRLIGDGSLYWYIQDLFINPAYQGHGIGKMIMEYLTRHIENSSVPGTTTNGAVCGKRQRWFL